MKVQAAQAAILPLSVGVAVVPFGSSVILDTIATFYQKKAEELVRSYDYVQAVRFYRLSIGNAAHSQPDLKAECYYHLAGIYMEWEEPTIALQLFDSALHIYGEIGDSVKYAKTVRRIANNYDYLGHLDMALEVYTESLMLSKRFGDKRLQAACYDNIAGIFQVKGLVDSSISCYNRGIQIAHQESDSSRLANIYHGLSIVYMNEGLYKDSEIYLDSLMMIAQLLSNRSYLGFAHQEYGYLYQEIDGFESAKAHAQKALHIAESIQNVQIFSNAYEILEKVAVKEGKFDEAYRIARKREHIHDSLYTAENNRIIADLKAKFQMEKTERELEGKDLQLQQAESTLKISQRTQWFLIILILLLCLVLIIGYRSYVYRNKLSHVLKRKNQKIQDTAMQLKLANDSKNRWFVNVAHELRTPLTLIKGPIQKVLATENLSEESRAGLRMAAQSSASLSSLVNEILELSKIEEGEVTLSSSVFTLNTLVQASVRSLEDRARRSGVLITFKADIPFIVEGDKDKLGKVVNNLLINAIKFTGEGGYVQIHLSLVDNHLQLQVKDTGIGILEEDMPFIFDRYYQSADKQRSSYGGTGIGLALSREIVQMHGGDIVVSNNAEGGACFSVTLPREMIKTAYISDDLACSNANSDTKPTLLLVEDNTEMQFYILSLLKKYFDVRVADNGQEALDLLGRLDVSMIVSDVMMPIMDGISFLKEVKANDQWKDLPFLYLSAAVDQIKMQEAIDLGIDGSLPKPFEPDELITQVRSVYNNYLRNKGSNGEKEAGFGQHTIDKLKRAVHDNIMDTDFDAMALAEVTGIEIKQLEIGFCERLGLTPWEFIEEVRLAQAYRLILDNRNYTTSDLARLVGFEQPAYFATRFEKRYGKKPGDLLRSGKSNS